ncbi:Venom protein [Armadillidium nasatum]|uniref:Venom protein n=1 Tax=Armadillidium nasatum TaxID=96803 RepID=A0A5N5T664_9CRUS|nr:Venom protein [Armadillidium nasatum]
MCEIPTCKFGIIKDVCNCCNICAKGKGDECGGPWGLGGKCAEGLRCVYGHLSEGDNFGFFRIGICQAISYDEPYALP